MRWTNDCSPFWYICDFPSFFVLSFLILLDDCGKNVLPCVKPNCQNVTTKKTCCHERIYFISIYYRLLRIYWLYEYYKLSLISQGFDRGDITANLKSLNTSYRVSQQVWEMLKVTFWSSEKFASKASYFYKILTQ